METQQALSAEPTVNTPAKRELLSLYDWSERVESIIGSRAHPELYNDFHARRASALASLAYAAPEAREHREWAHKMRLYAFVKSTSHAPGTQAALAIFFSSFT